MWYTLNNKHIPSSELWSSSFFLLLHPVQIVFLTWSLTYLSNPDPILGPGFCPPCVGGTRFLNRPFSLHLLADAYDDHRRSTERCPSNKAMEIVVLSTSRGGIGTVSR